MKKKVLGLLMAAVLCLCLLPVGALADETETKTETVTVDDVSADGEPTEGNSGRTGSIYEGSNGDATFSGDYYIIKGNQTIAGNLTIDGSQTGGLILCNGATLTVNGALIHTGDTKFYIYEHRGDSATHGRLIVNNSSGTGAAIYATGNNAQLGISSGEVEIHDGGSGKLVDGVGLYSSQSVHKGTLNGEVVLPEQWCNSTTHYVDSISGTSLVLEYCTHKDASDNYYTDYATDGNGTHHKYCTVCGFEWPEEKCLFTTPVYNNKYTTEGHSLMCSTCGTVSETATAEHTLLTAPTDDGKGHTTRCRDCAYTSGTPENHTYGEDGECSKCGFKPVAYIGSANDPDALYDSLQTAFIKAADGSTITLTANITPDENITFGEYCDGAANERVEYNKSVTLVMDGHTLYSTSNDPALEVAGGTLTIADAATITAKDNSSVAAVKVTGGSLTFKGTLTATGGSGSSSAAPAIEVTGGNVTFEGKVTATGGLQGQAHNLMNRFPAIKATGGELDFRGTQETQVDLDLMGGLTMTGGAKLTHGLTKGHFYLKPAGSTDSVNGDVLSVVDSANYKNLNSLLGTDRAFVSKNETNKYPCVGDNNRSLGGSDVTIEEHKHTWGSSNSCTVCGVTCDHSAGYENGRCKICNMPCSHGSLDNGDRHCLICNQWMVARIETKHSQGHTIYYHYSDLATALAAAQDGETVTLLEDVDCKSSISLLGDSTNIKTVTLDLANHNIRSDGMFDIGKLYNMTTNTDELYPVKLVIKGSGSITMPLTVYGGSTLDLSEWAGGTINELIMYNINVATTEPALIVGTLGKATGHINTLRYGNWWRYSKPAATTLNSGTYGAITVSAFGNETLEISGLLPEGYVFQQNDVFVGYNTKLSANGVTTITNLAVVPCTSHEDSDGDKLCDYCNADLTSGMVATLTTGGKTYYYSSLPAAIAKANTTGGTIQLQQDVTGLTEKLDINHTKGFDITLDLYGHTISGAAKSGNTLLAVSTFGTVTICDTSAAKNGKIVGENGGGYAVYVSDGKLIITDGTFEGADDSGTQMKGYALGNGTTEMLIITGGTFNSTVNALAGYLSRAEISGGTFTSLITTYGTLGDALKSGCGFKTTGEDSRWLTEAELKETTATSVAAVQAPIQSLTLKTVSKTAVDEDGKRVEVPSTMVYGTTGNVKLFAQIVDGGIGVETKWYKVSGEKAEPIDGAEGNTYTLPADLSAGIHTYRVIATAADYSKTVDISVTVTPIDLSSLDRENIKLENNGRSWFHPNTDGTGNEITQKVESVTVNTDYGVVTLKEGTDYKVVDNQKTKAGSYYLKIKPADNTANCIKEAKVSWMIQAFQLSRPEFKAGETGKEEITKKYDGTTALADDAILNTFIPQQSMPVQDPITLNAGDYEVISADYDSAGVGENKSVTCQIKLKNENYGAATGGQIMEFTLWPENADYYVPAKIVKADAPKATETGKLEVVNNHEKTYTYDLSQLLPELKNNCKYGEITYGAPTLEIPNIPHGTDTQVSRTGELTLKVVTLNNDSEGKIGTITVPVTSDNYKEITLTINLNATNKIVPTGAPTLSKTTLTYGQALSTIKLSGKLHDNVNNKDVEGTFEWVDGTFQPTVGDGTYSAAWKFTPTDKATYAETTGTVSITVNKATPSGAPKYTAITASGKKLSDAALAVNESWPAGTVKWELADTTEVKANTTYKWIFTPTDTANYTTATGMITLYSVSSGGGGGGSTTYPVSTPSKTENGNVSVSPKNASRGDTVTITVKPDDGFKLGDLTVTDKNGNELTLTDKGDGKYTFTMPAGKVEVKASFAEEAETSPSADVATDAYYYEAVKWAAEQGITGGIGNNLFGPNQPCTRAQIVTFLWRAAGSPEPKDMSSFADVSTDSYYAKAVAWAVENGITSGTGDGKFSPDATCTRAQAVTFLARALNAKASGKAEFSDVPVDSYFAEAVAWAAANGVTTGIGNGLFAPDNDCTRGQIVTFLYRAYMGK